MTTANILTIFSYILLRYVDQLERKDQEMAAIHEQLKSIGRQVKQLESIAELLHSFRLYAKTDGGHLTEFGKNFVYIALQTDLSQSEIAKFLDVSPAAISQHAAKMRA